ncbi:MAG: T9SS type A sorting domain-containing protein [Calditrichaceae bacterium]
MKYFLIAFIMLLTVFINKTEAQNRWHFNPDSLQDITVSGKAIVDSFSMHGMYFLDQDEDGAADYRLIFGPVWYQPDSSEAMRPINDELISIDGGLHESMIDTIPSIVVYNINGHFWREPYEAVWNQFGGHHAGDGRGHHGDSHGYAFGWTQDSVRTISADGVVIIDSTFFHNHFYLDENTDGLPDYLLNFGPPWYTPESGAVRPENGESVSVTGGALDQHGIPMLVVYEINGQIWRDSTNIGHHFGGGWIDRNMSEGRYIYTPFDSLDGMYINPGWHGGMMNHDHGGMMADSFFCRILEVYPGNIPGHDSLHVFAGYEIGLFNPAGENSMWENGHGGRHMNFASNVDFSMHYTESQLHDYQINEDMIEARYWDDQSGTWVKAPNQIHDKAMNTLSFSTDEVSNYIILTGSMLTTSIDNPSAGIIKDFVLRQNYPNPFNPETTIEFELKSASGVELSVYNILGQKIATLLDKNMNAGLHKLQFDGKNLPSGLYFYRLKAGTQEFIRKMQLIK